MKFAILVCMGLIASMNLMAGTTPSQSTDQFCADRSGGTFAKDLIKDRNNLMSFRNQGGLAQGGVCWWHSRFQRNALFLTIYKPAEKKPSLEQAEKIVGEIRSGDEIVIIPGFRNFSEFSYAHSDLIQRELEKWQKSDGILRFNWVNGLRGKNTVSADKLKEMMDELYQYVVTEGHVAYEKLQLKGITAHAWLVVNMKKRSDGYDLEVLDSNIPTQTVMYQYRDGQKSFVHQYFGEFVPYLERVKEMDKVEMTILKQCDPEKYKERKATEVPSKNDE